MQITEIKRPYFFEKLSPYKQSRVLEILTRIQSDQNFLGVLWGGSISYKEDISRSDVDLFCLVESVELAIHTIQTTWAANSEIDVVLDQGTFPWLGKTFTIYFKEDLDFSIDIGLIAEHTAQKFFWEPKGFVVLDRQGKIQEYLDAQSKDPNFTHLPFIKKLPFSRAIVALRKVSKNISRNHLWNAYVLMNQTRGAIMEIIRIYQLNETNFLGRPDRDIEDILPAEINAQLIATVASYDKSDIAKKTILLAKMIKSIIPYTNKTNEEQFEPWFIKQIDHEISNLQTQCDE